MLTRPGRGAESHRALRASPGDLREIGDRQGEGTPGQPGECLFSSGRPQSHRVPRAGAVDRPRDRRPARRRQPPGQPGLAYAALGEAGKAIELYEQALKISREIGDRRGEGIELGNLGIAYADLGEARKAIEFYEQALEIAREIGDRRGEGNHLGNLGRAYPTGRGAQSHRVLRASAGISREIGDRRGEGTTWATWGCLLGSGRGAKGHRALRASPGDLP